MFSAICKENPYMARILVALKSDHHPQKGAVRYSLLPDFVDAMGKFEFFVYHKKGIEPSQILLNVRREVI